MKIVKIKEIKRGNGLTELRKELRKDIKLALLLTSVLAPFPLLGLFSAPLWAWAIYFGWVALVTFAQKPARSYKKGKKFRHFEIGEDDAA